MSTLSAEKILKKYNIPKEFKIYVTLYDISNKGTYLPKGNFNHDFVKAIFLHKLKYAYLYPFTILTIYSHPNGFGKFLIYDNPSNEPKYVELNGDFNIKSFSIQSNDNKDVPNERTHNINKYYNNLNINKDQSNIFYILIILFVIACIYFYYMHK